MLIYIHLGMMLAAEDCNKINLMDRIMAIDNYVCKNLKSQKEANIIMSKILNDKNNSSNNKNDKSNKIMNKKVELTMKSSCFWDISYNCPYCDNVSHVGEEEQENLEKKWKKRREKLEENEKINKNDLINANNVNTVNSDINAHNIRSSNADSVNKIGYLNSYLPTVKCYCSRCQKFSLASNLFTQSGVF